VVYSACGERSGRHDHPFMIGTGLIDGRVGSVYHLAFRRHFREDRDMTVSDAPAPPRRLALVAELAALHQSDREIRAALVRLYTHYALILEARTTMTPIARWQSSCAMTRTRNSSLRSTTPRRRLPSSTVWRSADSSEGARASGQGDGPRQGTTGHGCRKADRCVSLDYSWASDRAGRPCLAAARGPPPPASLPARMPAVPGTVPRGPRE